MALIGTLRNKMGTWVVIFVFVAITSFILGDLWSGGSFFFFNNDNVGEIAGRSISRQEYEAAIQEREGNYILNFGRRPGDRDMNTLRQQAWEILVLRHAIQRQFDELGVMVTDDEVEDMIWGKNVDENIRETPAFKNPATGEFEKSRVVSYLNQFNEAPPTDPQQLAMWQEQRTRWEVFQQDLEPGRARIKYENLIVKTNYTTSAQTEQEYHNQTDVVEIKFLYVPYYAVSDSLADVSEDDLQNYYDSHKERFKTEATRNLSYVSFPIEASRKDSLDIVEEMKRIAADLAQSDDDSAYAASNTDGSRPFEKYNAGNIPAFVSPENLKTGTIIGPVLEGDSYMVVKVSSLAKDTVYTARASHILFKWDSESDADKKTAKAKAQKVLNEIKAGANFEAKAQEFGSDGSASKGGDLGWFSNGTDPNAVHMVKPFEKAVFDASKPGLLSNLVETEFGYHIVKVTNTKDNAVYKIAIVERLITPSDATTNDAYRKAEAFAANLSGEEEFKARAKEQGIPVLESNNLLSGERRIGMLGDARQVIMWLFRDAKTGKVSEVFDQKDSYVVAVMTDETSEGYRPVKNVSEEITPEVREEIKGKIIIDKLKGLTGTLEQIVASYGNEAAIYNSSDLKLMSNNLAPAGFDPKAVGIAFSLENGKRSAPFAGENGVMIIELQNKTIAPAMEDYSIYKMPIEQNQLNRSGAGIIEAIKEDAKIEDERYKFY